MNSVFLLNGSLLTPQDVVRISKDFDQQIDLTSETWTKIKSSRQIVENMISQQGKVVYGINTGFGNFANKVIPKSALQQLQLNLIRSHAVGIGNPLELHQARAMLLLRINTLAKSRSGISESNLRKLIGAFNKKYIAHIPQKGTVGASGDLAPLSHIVLGLVGEGLAWDWQTSQFIKAQTVLDKLKIQRLELLEKQGLALINGTQFMSALACQALILAEKIHQSAEHNISLFMEIFGYPTKLLSEEYQKQIFDHSYRQYIKKMRQRISTNPSPLYQKRLSEIKYTKQIASSIKYSLDTLSACSESIRFARRVITGQINGATDNPLVFSKSDGFEKDMLVSAGNFHGEYVAKAVDFLSIAINSLGKYADRRVERYVNNGISNLPLFLVQPQLSGINSGVMIMQYTSAALTSENKLLSKPASVDSISTSAGQQDHVSMGGYGARKCLQLVKNVGRILAIEIMCASKAVGLINLKPCESNVAVLQLIRKRFPDKKEDFYYGECIKEVQDLIYQGIINK